MPGGTRPGSSSAGGPCRASSRVPGGEVRGVPGSSSFAAAAGSATGLSLRSPRAFKIFSRTRAPFVVPAAPALLSFARWKTSRPPGAGRLRSRPMRLRAFPRRDTPPTQTPPPGTGAKGARHRRHHRTLRHDHLREAGLRRNHHTRRVHLHRWLRAGLPRLRRPPPRLVGRPQGHRAPVLIHHHGAHRAHPPPR